MTSAYEKGEIENTLSTIILQFLLLSIGTVQASHQHFFRQVESYVFTHDEVD